MMGGDVSSAGESPEEAASSLPWAASAIGKGASTDTETSAGPMVSPSPLGSELASLTLASAESAVATNRPLQPVTTSCSPHVINR
jgi:hypothetical protein